MTEHHTHRLKISQLARLAAVPPATIKHYVNQGLLPKPAKTGRTMAWYDPVCVERIQTIKRLQREKFLPLDLIRRLLDSGEDQEREAELGRAMARYNRPGHNPETLSEKQLLAGSGAGPAELRLLESLGLVTTSWPGQGRPYDEMDRRIVELAMKRRDLGLPLEYAAGIMKVYAEAVAGAVREDSRRFVNRAMARMDTSQALQLLTEADGVLDEFILLYRHREQRNLARQVVSQLDLLGELPARINILPVTGAWLPARPPEGDLVLYHLLAGNYAVAAGIAQDSDSAEIRALGLLSRLLAGGREEVLAEAEEVFPEPCGRPLPDAVMALILAANAAWASGFTQPVRLAGRAMSYLETDPGRGAVRLFFEYLQGAIYLHLPDLFNLQDQGRAIWEKVLGRLEKGGPRPSGLSSWGVAVVTNEVYPAVEQKIRFRLDRPGRTAIIRRK
jgi:DNA-binding transcriptional MerR regulator